MKKGILTINKQDNQISKVTGQPLTTKNTHNDHKSIKIEINKNANF